MTASVIHIVTECTRATSLRSKPLRCAAPSPECGPAPVTTVPAYIISSDSQNTACAASHSRRGAGSGRSSKASCTTVTQATIRPTESTMCSPTTQGLSWLSTVSPPTTPCRPMPRPIRMDSILTRRARTVRKTVMAVPSAMAISTKVSSRLPNSMKACHSASGCGTYEPASHCGQVGQPSPDLVSRTSAPVHTMAMLATRFATAHRCRLRRPFRMSIGTPSVRSG